MILPKKGSRQHIVNIFSEFILDQLPKECNSIINVADCQNFYVIKGFTNHKEPLNINEISDIFKEKFNELLERDFRINVIDLIEYDNDSSITEVLISSFYKSDHIEFHQKQLEIYNETQESTIMDITPIKFDDTKSFVISEFPYGFSKEMGKKLYFLSKKMSRKIMENHNLDYIIITTKFIDDSRINFKVESQKNINFNIVYNYKDLIDKDEFDIFFEDLSNPIHNLIISE